MNVLSVIHYPVFGGPHNRNIQVAPLLREQGVNTIILLPNDHGNAADRIRAAGVEVVQISLGRIRTKYNLWLHAQYFIQLWSNVRAIRKLIRDRNIQVVQINGLLNPHAAIAAKLEGIPVVWQILDTFPPMLLRRILMPMVTYLADVIMCTGEKVAREHPGATTKQDRLLTFFPPVNLEKFKPNLDKRMQARFELDIQENDVVVGNVSNINPMKGHIWFIRAAALLRKTLPNARFVILGVVGSTGGEYAQQLWSEAERLGLRLGMELIVLDPGNRVADLEQAFDIFWMTPEPQSEGIPTVIEEAMTLGLPVIAADVGSICEVVTDGVTGFVVPVHDPEAIAEATYTLVHDDSMMTEFSQSARQCAIDKFSSSSCAAQHLLAYEIALGI